MDLQRWITLPSIHLGSLISEGWNSYRGASQWNEVPLVEPSVRLALGAVVDRLFTVATNVLTGVPSPDAVRRFNSEAREMRDFLETNGWIEDPEDFHVDPPPVSEWASEEASTFVGTKRQRYTHVQWQSGYAPHPGEPGRDLWMSRESNHTMHAYVLEHEGPPRPWLVCVHGFGMGIPIVNFNGFGARHLHEELGLNLIFPVLPLHGPRGAARLSGTELLQPDYLNLMHTFTQAVWDVRRTLEWVRSRGADGVGLYGISLGGYISALVSSLVDDLTCAIAAIPMVDLTSVARDNEPWLYNRYDHEFRVNWEVIRSVTHVVSPLSLRPRIPREQLFICAGTADRVVRPNHARALWRHWERPEIHWFSGSHVMGMLDPSVPRFVERSVRAAALV